MDVLSDGVMEVQEALDAAMNSEGDRQSSAFAPTPNQHKPEKVRRLLMRFLDECPEEMSVRDLRQALDA